MALPSEQVGQLYQNVLGRKADQGGLDFYTKQLRDGKSIQAIEREMRGSDEFQALQNSGNAPQSSTAPTPQQTINNLYNQQGWSQFQGDEGNQYWKDQIASGVTGDALRQKFQQAGNEYLRNQGMQTPDQPIQNPGVNPGGAANTGGAGAQNMDPTGQVNQLYKDFGWQQYQKGPGTQYWVDQLNSGVPYEQVRQNFERAGNEYLQSQNVGQGQQRFGLGGAESAIGQALGQGQQQIRQGGMGALSALAGTSGMVNDMLGQASQEQQANLNRFGVGSEQASQQQAALSGALGPEAQQQAMNATMNSPEYDFIREQGRRELMANSAATGGTGGGEVMRDLQRFGQGLASQQLGTTFNRLGAISGRGLQAQGQASNLAGQLAGQRGNITSNLGTQGAQTLYNTGTAQAQMGMNAGNNIANMRMQAGRDIANNLNNRSSGIANLVNQQGAQMSGIADQFTSNIGNLLAGAGQNQANLSTNRAQLLQALATQNAAQGSQAIGQAGQAQANANLAQGNIYGNLGNTLGAMGAFGAGNQGLANLLAGGGQ